MLFVVLLLGLLVSRSSGGCAEVDSETEAVAGRAFTLGCISCKTREELAARATVDWFFRPDGEPDFRHIFHYDHPEAQILDRDFADRLEWRGTPDRDVQNGAVAVSNVSFSDAGSYRCRFQRTLLLKEEQTVTVEKEFHVGVVAVANRELTSVVAEILMYVLIVLLTLWLIAVVVYCYRKIWEEQEAREARRALKTQQGLLQETEESAESGFK